MHSIFFEEYERVFSENGDIGNLDSAHYSGKGIELSGYNLDLENNTLSLAACDFRQKDDLQDLKKDTMDTKFKHLENFFRQSKNNSFFEELEETSASFNLAYSINQYAPKIERIN